MKQVFISLIIAVFAMKGSFGAPGDTLTIQSHNETHWSWNNQYPDTVQFPTSGTFQKIIMHYRLGCPGIGCSEWDYKTNIELWNAINDSTIDRYELARVITPYAGDKQNGWFHDYQFDVTDYAPLLTGEKIINAYYGGFQDGFTISIWFDFIEGTPPRDVLRVDKVYRSGPGGFRYGDANDPIEDHLNTQVIDLEPNAEGATFRLVATGHGFGNDASNGNPDNCAEFCAKWFKVTANSQELYQNTVWRDDCGSEANQAQTGTWIYNRAGWCPGGEAQIFDHDLSSSLNFNDVAINVDWEPYTYTGGSGFPIHYWLEAQLFQYGDFNYSTDAEITQVLRPTDFDRQSRLNPTCGAPIIEIKNNGETRLDLVKVRYGVSGGKAITTTFNTFLEFGESQQLELPIPPENFFQGNGNTFYADLIEINGALDENVTNNRVESSYEITPYLPQEIIVRMRTNNTLDNEYFLFNSEGDTIINGTGLSVNSEYLDTLNLDSGCYTLHVTDAAGDGLQWWANQAQGSGTLQLLNLGLNNGDSIFIETIDSDFGSFSTYVFTVGYKMNAGNPNYDINSWQPPNNGQPLSDNKNIVSNPIFGIYPNPTKDFLSTELIGYQGNYTVRFYSITGAIIKEENCYSNGTSPHSVSVGDLPVGLYQVIAEADGQLHSAKIMIQ